MADRADDLSGTAEPIGLRLFAQSPVDDVVPTPFAGEEGLDADAQFDELPDDLLELAERLAGEAKALSLTYPARTPDRLPIGDLVAGGSEVSGLSTSEAIASAADRDQVAAASRHRLGLGAAAAAGVAAILGSSLYFGADHAEVRTTERIDGAAVHASPDATSSSGLVSGAAIRPVSLSLSDDGDYRRVETLLRHPSEPEREALFDLLAERHGESAGEQDGESAAVRISF